MAVVGGLGHSALLRLNKTKELLSPEDKLVYIFIASEWSLLVFYNLPIYGKYTFLIVVKRNVSIFMMLEV